MEMVVDKEKQEIRRNLLKKLLSLTKEEIKRRSENVGRILSTLPIYNQAKIVMAYYPIKGEVNILDTVRKEWGIRKFCFPVMDLGKKDLCAYGVEDLNTDFREGPFGVMEPDPNKAKKIEIEDIDLILVPGLAFDYHRNRLGRGAGFYDRYLKRKRPSAHTAGIAFECQILDSLPTHYPFDEKVDIIVSEYFTI